MDIYTLALSIAYTNKTIKAAELEGFKVQVETTRDILETVGEKKIFYFLPKVVSEPQNGYDEYIYVNDSWELMGSTDIDLSGYMTLAPLNPTAEEIAAMSNGQLYGDTVNHKGELKGGQSFYDTVYIEANYRKTIYHSHYRPPCVTKSESAFKIGDTWVTHDSEADYSDQRSVSNTDRTYKLTSVEPSLYISGDYIYTWVETSNNAFDIHSNYMVVSSAVRPVNYGLPLGSCVEDAMLSVGNIVWTKDVDENITGLFLVTNTYFTYHEIYQCYIKHIESIELSIPYNTYTKTEIDTMIGDIETALSEV